MYILGIYIYNQTRWNTSSSCMYTGKIPLGDFFPKSTLKRHTIRHITENVFRSNFLYPQRVYVPNCKMQLYLDEERRRNNTNILFMILGIKPLNKVSHFWAFSLCFLFFFVNVAHFVMVFWLCEFFLLSFKVQW